MIRMGPAAGRGRIHNLVFPAALALSACAGAKPVADQAVVVDLQHLKGADGRFSQQSVLEEDAKGMHSKKPSANCVEWEPVSVLLNLDFGRFQSAEQGTNFLMLHFDHHMITFVRFASNGFVKAEIAELRGPESYGDFFISADYSSPSQFFPNPMTEIVISQSSYGPPSEEVKDGRTRLLAMAFGGEFHPAVIWNADPSSRFCLMEKTWVSPEVSATYMAAVKAVFDRTINELVSKGYPNEAKTAASFVSTIFNP